MPVEVTNQITMARRLVRKTMAGAINTGAKAHVVFSQLIVPKDKRRLERSIRQTEEATEQSPRATVEAGGIVVDGVLVDYAEAVELGYVTESGTHVGAQPYFVPGVELARDRITQEGYKVIDG